MFIETSVRLFPQSVCQRLPAPCQIPNRNRLLGVLEHDAAKDCDLVAQNGQGLLHRPAGQAIALVEPQRVPRQHDSFVGFLVSHDRSIVRPAQVVNGSVAHA